MFIKSIELNNFRVYHDKCLIEFQKDSKRNIHIVSGYNGYGKTTFLTSLVWCLYGKMMKDVEDVFKQQIDDLGGYPKYITSCQNKLSAKSGEKEFSVTLTLSEVNIPSVACEEVIIKRTGYSKSGLDDLEIFIDGHQNELTNEVGNEMFIQDFILPKEIAKFFFFDAEKIVQLAETKSVSDKRTLSKAYSEVLGIKKYEDLKTNLSDLRIRFRKSSAKKEDKVKFEKLSKSLAEQTKEEIKLKIKLEKKEDLKIELRKMSDDLQENLIRKGSSLSVNDINNLKIDKYKSQKDIEFLKEDFKQILEFAPFAIASKLLNEVEDQVDLESSIETSAINQKDLKKRANRILKEFKKTDLGKSIKNRDKIDELVKSILEKHLHQSKKDTKPKNFKALHEFSIEDKKVLEVLQSQLQSSYADRVKSLAKDLRDTRIKYNKISKKLSNAESKESDGVIKKYRDEKTLIDQKLLKIDADLMELNQRYGSLQNERISNEKVVSELAKKIKIREQYIEKDKVAERLIEKLTIFLTNIKEEKKVSLETKILASLKKLMHKKGMIRSVDVEVFDELIEIVLKDNYGEEIDKNSLSKGEQQLYATALLKALVEESNIEFPVFIDSPLQKFDPAHATNIIKQFYPKVSKQVILFPLLEKEMTEKEFILLEKNVKSCYLIKNEGGIRSYFERSTPKDLFEQSKIVNHV